MLRGVRELEGCQSDSLRNLKILEMAAKWKRKREDDSDDDDSDDDSDDDDDDDE